MLQSGWREQRVHDVGAHTGLDIEKGYSDGIVKVTMDSEAVEVE